MPRPPADPIGLPAGIWQRVGNIQRFFPALPWTPPTFEPQRAEHGTPGGWRIHKREHTPTCDDCREARARYQRGVRRQHAELSWREKRAGR